MKIIAMVPGRFGSERFKKKNFSNLKGSPLMSYALNSSIESKVFDKVILNGDTDDFKKIADSYNVEFYKRPSYLGTSEARSDDVVYDFIKKFGGDIIVWVNPICPLMTSKTVKKVVEEFIDYNYDSAITGRKIYAHTNIDNHPVNYDLNNKFAKTQDLNPIFLFSYSIMIWKTSSFLDKYEKDKSAFIFGEFGEIEVDFFSSLTVKYEHDLEIIRELYPLVYNDK